MKHIQKAESVLSRLDVSSDISVPCDRSPGQICRPDGSVEAVITAGSRIVIEDRETGENRVFSPVLYQSCMNPENLFVYTMEVRQKNDTELWVATKYDKSRIDLCHETVSIRRWFPEVHKRDCRYCENCGRCS